MTQDANLIFFDVIIVGAGPGGLMTAMTLARLGVKPIVIDSANEDSHTYGRSDAFHPRCIEVMKSFGAPYELIQKMSKTMPSRAFWEISPTTCRRTALSRFFPKCYDFESDCPIALRQGLIEQVMVHDIESSLGNSFRIQWNWSFVDMELPRTTSNEKFCKVTIRHSITGEEKYIRAKYVIGADGAKSAVRRWAGQFGVKLMGEALPVTWCVLDAVGLRSDYPDLERLTALRSTKGILLVIPREPVHGKPTARFDIQLNKSRNETTVEDATKLIKELFHPFKVEWDEVNWWSTYDVGQRIINQYSIKDKVFLVGDACHTHSPRAGLGLNTAVLEAHNLGWKLALVLKGLASPEILATYTLERHVVAKELIQMDRSLVEIYAGLEKQTTNDFSSKAAEEWLTRLNSFLEENSAYQAGASIVYNQSSLTCSNSKAANAVDIKRPGLVVGARTRPAIVTRMSDCAPVSVVSPFDGRFTIYVLVGDLSHPGSLQRLLDLDAYIRKSNDWFGDDVDPAGCLRNVNLSGRLPDNLNQPRNTAPVGRELYTYDYDDIRQITAEFVARSRTMIRLSIVTTCGITTDFVTNQVMDLIYPRAEDVVKHGSHIFRPQQFYCDDVPALSPYRETAPEVGDVLENPMHDKWGVDTSVGSIVVARPDAHVALKTNGFDIRAWEEVEKYFKGFLRVPRRV